MKKLLLSIFAVGSIASLNAQTTIYTASTAADFQNFTIIDADQDGKAWGLYDLSAGGGAGTSFDAQAELIGSNSWDTVALTPDNWAITPVLDLTGMTSCSVDFGRAAVDPSWPAENYSVYAVSAADVNAAAVAFASATALFTETIATGDAFEIKSADLSSLDNMANVYIAFRHHDCTDQYLLVIDDITVKGTGTPVSINENEMNVTVYPNPANDVLNIKTDVNATSVSIVSLDGKIVSSTNLNGTMNSVNVSNLVAGVYFYTITSENGNSIRNSFVKK
jgi:hypothetical protein